MEKIYKFIFNAKISDVRMEAYIFEGTDYTTNHGSFPEEDYKEENILLLRNPETNKLIKARVYPEEIDKHIQSFYGGEYIFYSRNDDMNNFLQRLSKELELSMSYAKEDEEKYRTNLYWAELRTQEVKQQYNALKEVLESIHDKDNQERE